MGLQSQIADFETELSHAYGVRERADRGSIVTAAFRQQARSVR